MPILRLRRLLVVVVSLAVLTAGCASGAVNVYAFAKTPFNEHTGDGANWSWMNHNYESMLVWSPYWDQRLGDFSDAVVYRNAYALRVDGPTATANPDWILRDGGGDPIYVPFGCNNGCPQYAIDIGNPEYRLHWLLGVQALVDEGYTGIYIDDVNYEWRFGDANGDDATPVNPRTGRNMTLREWQRSMTEFLELVRTTFPQLEIWHNTIWYSDSPDFDLWLVNRQIRAADIIHLERGMNDPGLKSGSSKFGMETFMAFIDRVHEQDRSVALLDTHAENSTDQWYNIAGYLLITDGSDLISTEDWDRIAPGSLFGGFRTDLGYALGPREVVGETIRREFTGGLVIMNQPRSPRVTVQLDQPWLTQNGATVTRVTLDTREAIVLLRPGSLGGAPTPTDD